MSRRRVKLILITSIVIGTIVLPTFATNGGRFVDVPESHWAYEAVMCMADHGILLGRGDGTFGPEDVVTREEFAAMMVRALKLETVSPAEPTFIDVPRWHWAYGYVEAAKNYLTGWRLSDGSWRYKPTENAVREDMAVALVKAKKLDNVSYDDSKLDVLFSDAASISKSCRKYVAIAIDKGLMTAYGNIFNPQGVLTRAQAAILIYNASIVSGSGYGLQQKVSLDEGGYWEDGIYRKVSMDDEDYYWYDDSYYWEYDDSYYWDDYGYYGGYPGPQINVVSDSSGIHVSWDRIIHSDLRGYRVVVSRYDSTPSYPENGYLYYFTDVYRTYADINNSTRYTNGDFGDYLASGSWYYVSVTAVYKNGINVPGNAVRVQYKKGWSDDTNYQTPQLTATSDSSGVHLSWSGVSSSRLICYKVVVSRYNSDPTHLDSGWLYTIYGNNAADRTDVVVDNSKVYNDGDFGKYLVPGYKYYFRVVAVYQNDVIKGSNVLRLEYRGPRN